jgi:hypothetical protein
LTEQIVRDTWSQAGLRIYGDTVVPEKVGAALGLQATRTHVKGQLRKNGKDRWGNSLWFFESPLGKNRGLNDHLAWLLDHLESKIPLLNTLSQSHRVDLFCGFSSGSGQGGFLLDTSTLARLGRLGVPLVLDLYPPAVEDGIEEGADP